MAEEASIRRARPDEASALTDIAHAAKRHWGYPERWIASWRDALTLTPAFVAAHPVYLAAGPGGEPVGCYALGRDGPLATLEHLWVRPEWMGHGVGRALLAHAAWTAASLGAPALQIDSDPHAEPFYVRAGAQRVGEVPADVDGVRRTLPRLVLPLPAPYPAVAPDIPLDGPPSTA